MLKTAPVTSIGRSRPFCQTKRAPSRTSSNGWRCGADARGASVSRSSRTTAETDSTAASTKAAEAPAQATSAPASAGPAVNAALRASSSLPLADASASRGTSAGTRAGAATLKPTVPTAPRNPSTASHPMPSFDANTMARSTSSDTARNPSAHTINRCRDMRSASRPSGIETSRKGKAWTAARNPTSPGPAPSISTATSGTAARLSCSADCAARLAPARFRKERGRAEGMR